MKLKDAAEISAGYPFRGKICEVRGGGVKVIQMKDVSFDAGVDWSDLLESELTGKKTPEFIRNGDILFVARGLRNYAICIEDPPESVVCAPHFYLLKTDAETINPVFLAWLLNQAPSQNVFDSLAEGSAAKSLRRSLLENIEIVVPPIEQQNQIADLNKLMQKQNHLHGRMIANANKMMSAIASNLNSSEISQVMHGEKTA